MNPQAVDVPAALTGRLRAAVDAAGQRAREVGHPVLAWAGTRIPAVDPIAIFDDAAGKHDRLLWIAPDRAICLVGIGSAWAVSTDGAGRFAEAGAAWQALLHDAVGDAGFTPIAMGHAQPGPVLMGGFAFAPQGPVSPEWEGFPAGLLTLPRICVASEGGETRLVLSRVVTPDGSVEHQADEAADEPVGAAPSVRSRQTTGEHPPGAAWKSRVAASAQAVRDGILRKVVLARSVRVRGGPFDPIAALRMLSDGYPGCTLFAVARGARCFLGATPERLVRVRGGEVSAMALAGTAPRGRDDGEDRRLGELLLASSKDRIEHAAVVDLLREDLAGACTEVSADDGPDLLKVANVQHLCTPLTAKIRPPLTLLDLVARLHPTPAVGGVPRETALEWIRRHEGLDRGWYAGPVGWVDQRGEGEFAVAIRSALLHGDEAVLFAGCGIVADSDPDQEYAESRLKLRPMLSALGIREESA
ncbi:MAG: isochorismate synthase [bacterium]|nr:isochorismate synthase [bacterium]